MMTKRKGKIEAPVHLKNTINENDGVILATNELHSTHSIQNKQNKEYNGW